MSTDSVKDRIPKKVHWKAHTERAYDWIDATVIMIGRRCTPESHPGSEVPKLSFASAWEMIQARTGHGHNQLEGANAVEPCGRTPDNARWPCQTQGPRSNTQGLGILGTPSRLRSLRLYIHNRGAWSPCLGVGRTTPRHRLGLAETSGSQVHCPCLRSGARKSNMRSIRNPRSHLPLQPGDHGWQAWNPGLFAKQEIGRPGS
jgi:hypothetical protein